MPQADDAKTIGMLHHTLNFFERYNTFRIYTFEQYILKNKFTFIPTSLFCDHSSGDYLSSISIYFFLSVCW